MPLTDFQRSILGLIKQHRNPNSYIAGGIAIHRSRSSNRYSNDIDFFHDTDEEIAKSSKADLDLLKSEGFEIELLINQPSFVRAIVSLEDRSLKLEWVRDTAFRFFPVIEDEELGYRMHDVDLAVNKCLALANRNEVRDIVDLILLNQNVIGLASACWGACGKDPGFTPELLFDCMRRHSIIDPQQLAAESLNPTIAPHELKRDWLKLLDEAQDTVSKFPVAELGCIYLKEGKHIHPLSLNMLSDATPHYGSLGGSWPRIAR